MPLSPSSRHCHHQKPFIDWNSRRIQPFIVDLFQKTKPNYPMCQHRPTLKLVAFGYEQVEVRMRLGLASRQTVSTCAENNSKTFIIVTPNNTIEKEKPHLTTFQTTSGFIEIYTFFFQLYVYFTFFSLIIIIVLVQIFPLPPFRLQGMVCLFIFLINCIVKYMQSQGSH